MGEKEARIARKQQEERQRKNELDMRLAAEALEKEKALAEEREKREKAEARKKEQRQKAILDMEAKKAEEQAARDAAENDARARRKAFQEKLAKERQAVLHKREARAVGAMDPALLSQGGFMDRPHVPPSPNNPYSELGSMSGLNTPPFAKQPLGSATGSDHYSEEFERSPT
eukprot:NODE_1191_length_645_cov_29.582375_g1182_i0.p1 GENE.NODE_1191_length_645_cov_29.582375_g1182_i0~~NODE_1191_length_645_cov_29.582375_g1182_i0.p1  ORF type:complete len:172 (+),score=30.18 NODE_1191_length_645_cov_29.582375_g1182_i0:40-555(+)